MTRTAIALTVLALATAASATATAGAAYRGKTKSGTSITFTLAGNAISGVSSSVPTVCLESTSHGSRAGIELYRPPASFRVGATAKTKALQPAAMNGGIKATKNYIFTSHRGSGGTITGTLKLSFSFIRPGVDIYHSYIYICSGSTTFTASAR